MIMLMGEDIIATIQSLNLFQMQNMATSPYGLAEYLKFQETQPTFHCNFDHILVAGGALTKQLATALLALGDGSQIDLPATAEAGRHAHCVLKRQ
jgi:hypothetical protein